MSESEKKALKPRFFLEREMQRSSCRLRRGTRTFSKNPGHVIVKCFPKQPMSCGRYEKELVARHHVYENLELWKCTGCLDVLIKIDSETV